MYKVGGEAIMIEESSTTKVGDKLYSALDRGENIINMAIGELYFRTPEVISKAGIRAIHAGKTHYTEVAGIHSLREAISKKYSFSRELSYKNVIITNGAKQGIFNALASILEPDDEVVIPYPAWPSYKGMIELLGGKVIEAKTCPEKNFHIEFNDIQKVLSEKTKAIIINSPNNPTGNIMKKSEIVSMIKYILDKDIYLISDEVYENYVYIKEYTPISSFFLQYKKMIIVNSFSKSYAMTGWRIGFAIADEAVIKRMISVQSNVTSCPNSIAQYAALSAINSNAKILFQEREELKKNRKYFLEELEKTEIFNIYGPPEGTFYIFTSMKPSIKIPASKFIEIMYEKYKILLMPWNYGGKCYIRFSFAQPIENIRFAIEAINNFKNTYRKELL